MATIIGPNQAIRLSAKKELIDRLGQRRVAGENWLIKKPGAYLPLAYEIVVNIENAYVLTNKKALHLRALKTFIDDFGQTRNNGDEWLVTVHQTETHILNVYEQLVTTVDITVLNSRQYCIVLNPVSGRVITCLINVACLLKLILSFQADGKNQLGKKKLVVGEKSFFLQPDEQLEKGIQDVYLLDEDEGLVLKCIESFEDEIDRATRTSGKISTCFHPNYLSRLQLLEYERREMDIKRTKRIHTTNTSGSFAEKKSNTIGYAEDFFCLFLCFYDLFLTFILTDENEGIYVRDTRSGRVRAVIGKTYMLTEYEELWEKELPTRIEQFLQKNSLMGRYVKTKDTDTKTTTTSSSSPQTTRRDKWKLVTYRVPQNEAVQVYDYKAKQSRIIFGPDLVMLGPDEDFTYINLAGSFYIAVLLLAFLFLVSLYKKITGNRIVLFSIFSLLTLWFFYPRFV